MKRIFILILIVAPLVQVFPQDLDLVGKEKPFKINGGVSLNQVAYWSDDTISKRDPYNYFISGNLNMSLYGWSVPLTFSFSNQKFSYTQPFNQYSMHPTYKWVKLHIGYTSMTFSPYTLNGHLFLGGGVELTPEGPFTVSAMYGRLKKATEFDSTLANPVPPEFERWGYGLKGTYELSTGEIVKSDIGLTIFQASDKPGSLNFLPDSMAFPGRNFVFGTNINVTIKGGFKITGELASSAVTDNVNSELEGGPSSGWRHLMGNMVRPNATTQVYSARHFNITYGAKIYSIGLGYERIDPGYRTFGAYYFNNDMENITLNGSLRLLKDKITIGANVGKQRDNLDNNKVSEFSRWVTAVNVGYNSGDKLSASLSWSTFNSYTNIKSEFEYINEVTPYDNLDTLDFTQLSASGNANVTYALQNTEKVRQNLSLNFSLQNASEKQGYTDVEGGSRFYNGNAAYSYSLVPLGLTISAALNTNFNIMPDMNTSTVGPTLSATKMFLDKKLRASMAFSYNEAFTKGKRQNRVAGLRSNATYRLAKRHNFSLGLTYMNRTTNMQEESRKLSELVGNFGYSFSF